MPGHCQPIFLFLYPKPFPTDMNLSNANKVTLPEYRQMTVTIPLLGGFGIVLGIIGLVIIPIWLRIKMNFMQVMGVSVACSAISYLIFYYIPLTAITLANLRIRRKWHSSIGRSMSWEEVKQIPADKKSQYELIRNNLFIGNMSFGTYQTVGGWYAILLRQKTNGMLWVVKGQFPEDCETYNIKIYKIDEWQTANAQTDTQPETLLRVPKQEP